jgi:regulator of replication initiation timing
MMDFVFIVMRRCAVDELKKEFKALSNIHWIISFCTFDESDNEYRSERISEYSLGFVNGTWYAMQEQQSKIEQLQAELSQQNVQLMHASQNVQTLSRANEYLDIEREKLREEKEVLEKEKKDALSLIEQAEEGYYGFSKDGGDTDSLARDIKKAFRGENE